MSKPLGLSEHQIQCQIIEYLRIHNIMVFSVPNGVNIKNVRSRSIFKESGLTSGVSDLIIVLDKVVVFVEVKTAKGKQSDSQMNFERLVTERNHVYTVWRSLNDCIEFVRGLLGK